LQEREEYLQMAHERDRSQIVRDSYT